MDNLFHFIDRFKLLYRISAQRWPKIMFMFLLLWTALMLVLNVFLHEKQISITKRSGSMRGMLPLFLNAILALVGLLLIVLITFVRRGSSNHSIILLPLRVLYGYTAPRDYWHVTIMNIVLFIPFACGLSFCLEYGHGRAQSHPGVTTVLLCFSLSFAAETLQYFMGSGTAEVDDVLMNTLGAFCGTLPCTLCRRICKVES